MVSSAAIAVAPPAKGDSVIAQSLAQMLQEARTVISNNQELINNPDIGDKHLTGQVVLDQAIKSYPNAIHRYPASTDPNTSQGRLLRVMMDAIKSATDDNQAAINEKGTG